MTTTFTDLPDPKIGNRYPVTDPDRQVDFAEFNKVLSAIGEVQTYLEGGVLNASPSTTIGTATITTASVGTATIAQVNATHVDAIADATPTVGPEMDWKGYAGRWFVGVDVANAPTSRDFVLTGQRGTYSFTDGATTNGSPTLTSASGGGFVTALVGATITGTGIPNGTTVIAVGGLTSLTMSANATATASGVTVTITRSSVQDLLYWKHRGALSATLGVGVTPPDGSARLQVSSQDDEPAMGTIRLRRGPSQTGDVLAIHDSTPVTRVAVDKDFYLVGNNPTTSGGIAIAADATNQHALLLTDSTKTNFYAFDLPTGSGGVLRLRCQSGGVSALDVGTDGSVRHLSTKIGFFGASVAVKPTITGSRGGNAALASLLTALAGLGLITDSTTA